MLGRKLLIGGAILCLAMGYLGYLGFRSSATYYLTVSELTEQGDSIHNKNVRVNGEVIPESVERDTRNSVLKFTIFGEGRSLSVVYKGIIPDTFKADTDVVVEGRLDPEGIFEAHSIITKCPSRYEPEQ